jgi:cytochrome c-type biogenesis protein CcmH
MGAFLFAAMSLVAVTMLMLLRPWQRRNTEQDATVRELNTRIYRDQIAELDRDLAAGTLTPADHAHSRDELQRRLLDDSALVQTPPAQAQRTRHTTLLLAIAVPLAASGLYAVLGAPQALLPQAAAVSAGAHDTITDEVDQMVGKLAARLEKNPDDPKGWSMLARSYRVMGRQAEAQAAFAHIGDSINKDPLLLAEYADVLATQAGGNIEGKPLQLVMTALKLDPDHQMALSLAATAAYNRKDFPQAAIYWQRLLKQLPPESEEAQWLVKTMAEIGAPVATTTAAAAPAQVPTVAPADDAAAAPTAKSLSGTVRLSPELQAKVRPTDIVFIFARALDGSRVPLAVQRAQVSDLPLHFKLDDSSAMSPQSKLSGAARVRVEARVSRDGSANPAAGDPIGTSGPVVPGDTRVALTIDRVR